MEGLDVQEEVICSHDELRRGGVVERIRVLGRGMEVWESGMCSVVPSLERGVVDLLEQAGFPQPRLLCPSESDIFPSSYTDTGTLGADRYGVVLAARELYGAPVIVVDCGTATTFNVVDAEGVFLGGAIAPGLRTMMAAMHMHTAVLPDVPLVLSPLIGRDTVGCMRAGVIHGTRLAVEGMVREINKSMGPETPLIVTGGNAELLRAAGLDCGRMHWDAELLFRGVIFYLLLTHR